MSTSSAILVKEFAAHLGWHGLEQHQLTLTADICGSYPVGTVVTGYSTTYLKYFIQINESPVGQSRTYQAALVPHLYGLRPTGWHTFTINDRESAMREAERLKPFLSRRLFRNPVTRRQFLREHP